MSRKKKYIVELTEEERNYLYEIIKSKKTGLQKSNRARILLRADISELGSGWSDGQISEAFDVSVHTVERTRKKLVMDGMEKTTKHKKQKRTKARKFDGDGEAILIATACSDPPEGFGRWTLRLLADKMVELEVVEGVCHETVRQTLKKMKLNLG